jgi:hypothetical protein
MFMFLLLLLLRESLVTIKAVSLIAFLCRLGAVQAPSALTRDLGYLRMLMRSMKVYLWSGFRR